jgi:hypothetical protein
VSCGPRPCLCAEVGSGTSMCLVAPDLASLLRCAPALPRVPQLRTSLPCRGGLRRFHMSHGSGLCLPEGESSGATTSLRLLQAVENRNKERLSCPRHAAKLACFQGTLACYQGVYKTCGHVTIVWFNSATPAQLTTHGHGYIADTTRQYGTMALAMFSTLR